MKGERSPILLEGDSESLEASNERLERIRKLKEEGNLPLENVDTETPLEGGNG